MKDFTKWVDAWNTYNSAYDKAAEAGGGYSWTFFFMFLTFAASSVALFYGTKRKKPIVTTVATVFALVGAMGVIQTVGSRSPKEIEAAVKVEKPRTLKDEIKHVWGLGDITCNDTGGDIDFASSKTRLPDGDSSCVAYRKDGIVEVVAHADSGKLGLYRKSDGKPLRSVGEE